MVAFTDTNVRARSAHRHAAVGCSRAKRAEQQCLSISVIGVISGLSSLRTPRETVREHVIIAAMRSLRASVVVFAAALAILCAPISAAPTLQQLKGIEELKSWFNANAGHPRLVFLLSPT